MSGSINDGGPAFPEAIAIGPAGDVYPGMGGMSLRDWFAGMAMQALIHDRALNDALVIDAYATADAMLAARALRPTPSSPEPREKL